MHEFAPPLLSRLRRHRGLWVLAVAVLMLKLVASSVSLTDVPEKRLVSTTAASVSVTSLPVDTVAVVAVADDGSPSLPDETDSHSACAHTLTLPMAASLAIAKVVGHLDDFAVHSGSIPGASGSLFRPPIA